MTYERKITAGLDDIKAIIFECKKCKRRISMSPDSVGEPPFKCLHPECNFPWRAQDMFINAQAVRSPFSNFVDGLAMIRKWMAQDPNLPFTIILEFDETEMMKK